MGVGNERTGARHLYALERRWNADAPRELARLHPQPQDAERAHPGWTSGRTNVAHRECGAPCRAPGAVESGGGKGRKLTRGLSAVARLRAAPPTAPEDRGRRAPTCAGPL